MALLRDTGCRWAMDPGKKNIDSGPGHGIMKCAFGEAHEESKPGERTHLLIYRKVTRKLFPGG